MGREKICSTDVMVRACKQHLNTGKSVVSICRKLNVGKTTVNRWINLYRVHGRSGLEGKKSNRSYSKELKQKIINQVLRGESIENMGARYIIAPSVVSRWVQRYNEGGEITDYDPKPEVYQMKTRRTTKEEKLAIVLYCIDNDKNYKLTAERYGVRY